MHTWYHRYKKAIRGEWWIIDGNPIFADGDTGDESHATLVVDAVRSRISDNQDWNAFCNNICFLEYQRQLQEAKTPKDKQDIEDRSRNYNDLSEFLAPALKRTGLSDEEISIAEGQTHRIDVNKYGMKNFGWKAIRGNHIDTWTLTKEDLGKIAEAIYEINNDEPPDNEEFWINVLSNGAWYQKVPWHVIDSGDWLELRQYGSKSSVPLNRKMTPTNVRV